MQILSVLAAMMATAATLAAAPLLRIEDLGSFGGLQMSGMAIDQTGQVAGYGTDLLGNMHAFIAGNGVTTLLTATSSGAANGINGQGQVAGTTYADGHSQATLWSGGTAQILGGLGGPDSYGNSINGSQKVAGMATTVEGQGRAAIFSGSGTQDVSLPNSAWSSAYGINSRGAIAGYAKDAYGRFTAYTWSLGGGYTTLGTLGGNNSYAFGINDQGQIAGNASLASGYSHAFIWSGAGLTDLGVLGGASSYSYGINNAGSVVGYSTTESGSETHAFLYLGGTLFDLNLLVENLTGWELTAAYSISDAGQITGTGLFNGTPHAFRLDTLIGGEQSLAPVPEPATFALGLVGAAIIIARQARIPVLCRLHTWQSKPKG